MSIMNGNSNNTLNHHHHHFDPLNYDHIVAIADHIRSLIDLIDTPTIGIICGTGLGVLADMITNAQIIDYKKIPAFPTANVIGHKGNLVFGYLSGKYVVAMQGRFHPYEHHMNFALCAMPVRVMHALGVRTMIVSNAAGGINDKFNYGDLMLIKDHIFMPGLVGFSPLVGADDPRMGPRFVSMHDAYDEKLRNMAVKIAQMQQFTLHQGVYAMVGGPQYESPAEVRMLKVIGTDAIGMSTCHEVTVARQCGIRVMGFSLISNIANHDTDSAVEVTHEEVLIAGTKAGNRACKFVAAIVEQIEPSSLNDNNNHHHLP